MTHRRAAGVTPDSYRHEIANESVSHEDLEGVVRIFVKLTWYPETNELGPAKNTDIRIQGCEVQRMIE